MTTKEISFYTGVNDHERNGNLKTVFDGHSDFFSLRGISSVEMLTAVLSWKILETRYPYYNRLVTLTPSFSVDFMQRRVTGYAIECRDMEAQGNVVEKSSTPGIAFLFCCSNVVIDASVSGTDALVEIVDFLSKHKFWALDDLDAGHCLSSKECVVSLMRSVDAPRLVFIYVRALRTEIDLAATISTAANTCYTKDLKEGLSAVVSAVVDSIASKQKQAKHTVALVWSTDFNTFVSDGTKTVFYNNCYMVHDNNSVLPIRNPSECSVYLGAQSAFWGSQSALATSDSTLGDLKRAIQPKKFRICGLDCPLFMYPMQAVSTSGVGGGGGFGQGNASITSYMTDEFGVSSGGGSVLNTIRGHSTIDNSALDSVAFVGEGNAGLITPTKSEIIAHEKNIETIGVAQSYSDVYFHMLYPQDTVCHTPFYEIHHDNARDFVEFHKRLKCKKMAVPMEYSNVIIHCLQHCERKNIPFKSLPAIVANEFDSSSSISAIVFNVADF